MVVGAMTKIKLFFFFFWVVGRECYFREGGEERPSQRGDIWAEARMLRRSWPGKTTKEAYFQAGEQQI